MNDTTSSEAPPETKSTLDSGERGEPTDYESSDKQPLSGPTPCVQQTTSSIVCDVDPSSFPSGTSSILPSVNADLCTSDLHHNSTPTEVVAATSAFQSSASQSDNCSMAAAHTLEASTNATTNMSPSSNPGIYGGGTPGAGAAASHLSNNIEVKLFVGRLPRYCEQEHLRPIFEAFGQVSEVAILKDKVTGQHKGSAFVRMASLTQADAAIRALNNIKVMEPSLGPLQVRYATGEAEKFGFGGENGMSGQDQVKLFVGGLPRQISEEEIRQVFLPYGTIDEVFILKDNATGQPKGCAFVKFAFKEQAVQAIRGLSGIYTFPSGVRPIEVRVAESKKQQLGSGNYMMLQQQPSGSFQPGGAYSPHPGATALQHGNMPPPGGLQPPVNPAVANANPRQAGQWKEYYTQEGRPYYHHSVTNQTQWERPAEFEGLHGAVGPSLAAPTPVPSMAQTPGSARAPASGGVGTAAATDVAGPPGANIFIFHIPNEWAEQDLLANFSPFGVIVSSRIVTDKMTGRNKGFAFVSYNNINSAVQAVAQMNGFIACGKQLKVSIKQHEEQYVAHILPQALAQVQQQPAQQQQQQQHTAHLGPSMSYSTTTTSQQPQMSGSYGAQQTANMTSPYGQQQPQVAPSGSYGYSTQHHPSSAYGSQQHPAAPTGSHQVRYSPY